MNRIDRNWSRELRKRFPAVVKSIGSLRGQNAEDGGTKAVSAEPVSIVPSEVALIKCPKCGRMVDKKRVAKRRYICYECEGYFRVKTSNRIRMVADPGTFEEWFTDMKVSNPLNYEGYEAKLAEAREKTGLQEGVTVGKCKVFGADIVLGICDSRFLMASMGQVYGEKITPALQSLKSILRGNTLPKEHLSVAHRIRAYSTVCICAWDSSTALRCDLPQRAERDAERGSR